MEERLVQTWELKEKKKRFLGETSPWFSTPLSYLKNITAIFLYFLNGYLTFIQVNPEDLFRQAFGGNFDFESIFGADPSGQGQQTQNQTRTRVN